MEEMKNESGKRRREEKQHGAMRQLTKMKRKNKWAVSENKEWRADKPAEQGREEGRSR